MTKKQKYRPSGLERDQAALPIGYEAPWLGTHIVQMLGLVVLVLLVVIVVMAVTGNM